eukprot:5339222-Alexandrium_andersonii.AAC.1
MGRSQFWLASSHRMLLYSAARSAVACRALLCLSTPGLKHCVQEPPVLRPTRVLGECTRRIPGAGFSVRARPRAEWAS